MLLQLNKDWDLTINFDVIRWDIVTLSSLFIYISENIVVDLDLHLKDIDVVAVIIKAPNYEISTFIPSLSLLTF